METDSLLFTKQQIFRLVQTESICRQRMTETIKFVLGRVEDIVGKGENAGYQHFLLFPQCFQKASFSGSSKVGIVWKRVKVYIFFFQNSEIQ